MISILSPLQQAVTEPSTPVQMETVSDESHEVGVRSESDSEWVVGPPQMTALAFLATVVVALFSGISYMAGKAVQSDPLPAIQVTLPLPETPRPSIGDQFASYQATIAPNPQAGPIFADPAPGKSYIQMAAVERGVASVFAEGLRAHGLPSFVAPGATPNIYRVLIGPVSDTQSYKFAKQELDKIGLATFMRQYEK